MAVVLRYLTEFGSLESNYVKVVYTVVEVRPILSAPKT